MKNKHLLSTLLVILLCTMYSCGAKSSETPSTLSTDSIVCIKNENNDTVCNIIVDYPTGDDSLSQSVASVIKEELALQYLPTIIELESSETNKYKPYSGEAKDGRSIVEYYANGVMDYIKSQWKELNDEGIHDMPNMNYELQIRKVADNERYLSYRIFSYAFLGGAHGTTSEYTVNISKATNKRLLETVDTLKTKALQPILRNGVLRYFHEQGETEITESNVGDYLFLQNGIIPLPKQTPYLAEDGIHFIYQQYEIGPYAMGMVQFTIPFADIKPYLTQEALGLIKQ